VADGSRWLPKGIPGVLAALPFAIWFYLAIEELPLAAEEAHAPERDMPRGLLLGLATLVVGAALWYALGLFYFAVYARHRLVLSPEESFAVRFDPGQST
jgi:amino acid transporter